MNWPCAALSNADLADRTTLHVGGRVEWLLEPSDPEELRLAWQAARERGFVPRVLGGGANLLVQGGTLPGVVIATTRMRRVFRPLDTESAFEGDEEAEVASVGRVAPLDRHVDPRLIAWCGATLPNIVRTAQELGWSGLEGLVGVPGSVGGGVAMNAGGRPGCVWDVVESVRVLTAEGELVDRPRAECSPGYRDGGLGTDLCVGAVLALKVESKAAVRERMRSFLHEKRAKQPVTEWSCGCVFKNPDPELSGGRGAGQLIDDCGGKGLERGDAFVSPLHGNFIINRGGATADDVFGLIEDLRATVADRSGIELATEVQVWRADALG